MRYRTHLPKVISIALVVFLLAACGTSQPTVAETQQSLATPSSYTEASLLGSWPMFRHDLNHSGYNPEETVLKPPLELKWEYATEGKI